MEEESFFLSGVAESLRNIGFHCCVQCEVYIWGHHQKNTGINKNFSIYFEIIYDGVYNYKVSRLQLFPIRS